MVFRTLQPFCLSLQMALENRSQTRLLNVADLLTDVFL